MLVRTGPFRHAIRAPANTGRHSNVSAPR